MSRSGSAERPHGADATGPQRPSRPVLVEVASALLIVNGGLSALTSLQVLAQLAEEGSASGQLVLISFLIGIGSAVLGLLVRYGRAWLVTVNVVAVAGFLELTSGSPIGVAFGVLDVIILLALFREKPWFDWSPEASSGDRDGA